MNGFIAARGAAPTYFLNNRGSDPTGRYFFWISVSLSPWEGGTSFLRGSGPTGRDTNPVAIDEAAKA